MPLTNWLNRIASSLPFYTLLGLRFGPGCHIAKVFDSPYVLDALYVRWPSSRAAGSLNIMYSVMILSECRTVHVGRILEQLEVPVVFRIFRKGRPRDKIEYIYLALALFRVHPQVRTRAHAITDFLLKIPPIPPNA